MRFQSETIVFKFLRRSQADGALDNLRIFNEVFTLFTDHSPMLTSNSTGPSVDEIMDASKKHAKSLNLRLRKYG